MDTPSDSDRSDPERRVSELLALFYPVHYKNGIAFEDAIRAGRLTRKQTAILWLIHSEGSGGYRMRRKEIERHLQTWFEVSSSAITKALRSMSRAPLGLLRMVEDPDSAREKQVVLTTKGQKFVESMIAEGRRLIRKIVAELTDDEIDGGIRYLRKVTQVFEKNAQENNAGLERNQRGRNGRAASIANEK
jgi:DNA-binding MarR family transcriptional regulator